MGKRIAATTLGCKVNMHDTHALLAKFVDAGYEIVRNADDADICVVNTCCVTNTADKKSRQAVRRAKSRCGMVAAVGCACQANPARFAEVGADIVLGTANRAGLLEYIENYSSGETVVDKGDISDFGGFEANDISKIHGRTRAFLKIQDGCDNFCTFCIIPHVRGKSRSRPPGDVLDAARRFAQGGYKEIVVAGICVASYGKDLQDCNLLTVLEQICKIDGIERVRLSSVEPDAITPEFLGFVAKHPKFCDHLHLSLQSGCDAVLAMMGRKYTGLQFAEAVAALRKISPDISITTDVIAGFPGESAAYHRQTLDFIANLGPAALHVFPYSAKEGTSAAKMDNQLPARIKNERAKELIKLGDALTKAHNARFAGRVMPVLAEARNGAGFYEGKTTNYISVYFEGAQGLEGSILDVRLDVDHGGKFFGVLQYS
ncbi:MAG: tRNA (N(6)-L-threonylcarbamoyladenosine(37)-C(2))-methylthiotransferase MtaB [Clostridiales bacterium]|jgi:threonylcarbamoyladenosine tRNA methylthiotransferase MtaB|nr:tRNA (N(6)-L-threonylcarbamoyladenosine(37)-C(2))-methylthiotransferase MtaB [Clostridiales bacterium]